MSRSRIDEEIDPTGPVVAIVVVAGNAAINGPMAWYTALTLALIWFLLAMAVNAVRRALRRRHP